MSRVLLILFTIIIISCGKDTADSDISSTTNDIQQNDTSNSDSSGNNNSTDDNSGDSNSNTNNTGNENTSEIKVIFNSNVHSSLPTEWVEQYYVILDTLNKRIPVFTNNYEELDIYAWNSNANRPFSSQIGDASGACICGNDQGRYMVLEIPEDEFTYSSMHRYSVIAHEFFHAYQMSISSNFYNGDFNVKWLSEGSAAVFESIYVREHYDYNYFIYEQDRVDNEATTNPSIYENYDSGGDSNYSSSVFMTLALVKELVKLNHTEADAIRMVVKDFQERNPSASNWKEVFEEVFAISVNTFYGSLSSYQADINTVVPNEDLTLQQIFNN